MCNIISIIFIEIFQSQSTCVAGKRQLWKNARRGGSKEKYAYNL